MFENKKIGYILVGPGAPRNKQEEISFRKELSKNPFCQKNFLEWLRLLKSLKQKTEKKYDPDFVQALDVLSKDISQQLDAPCFAFHRYLPSSLHFFQQEIKKNVDEWHLFPIFCQFSYPTTGAIASFLETQENTDRFRWIRSYAAHPGLISLFQKHLTGLLQKNELPQNETIFLFVAESFPQIPQDLYVEECYLSSREILKAFPLVLGKLAFQKGISFKEENDPSLKNDCATIQEWGEKRKNIVFVPINTLITPHQIIENLQEEISLLLAQGYNPFIIPSFSLAEKTQIILQIIENKELSNNHMLLIPPFEKHQRRELAKESAGK